ncbi:hypothetical protein A9G24_03630 [Gilliamella sp. App6-5]|jgi:hypothetical protein|nr:hypothetical protein A9G24_03630 [Gilliamella apicola]
MTGKNSSISHYMCYAWNGIIGKYFIPYLIVCFIISINRNLVKNKNKIYGNIYNVNKKYKIKDLKIFRICFVFILGNILTNIGVV